MKSIPTKIQAALEGSDYAGPVSERLIQDAESAFGVAFPWQYRAFLRSFGATLLDGFEIFGLVATSSTPPIWTDIRSLARAQSLSQLPDGLIPISDDGTDYSFFLVCAATDGLTVDSVVVYGPGKDGVRVAPDFFTFIDKAATEGISSLASQ